MKEPRLVYSGLRVTDMKRSIAFYTGALGMRLQFQFRVKETGGRVAYLVSPGGTQKLELNWYPGSSPYRDGDQLDHLGFKVGDLRAVHRKLIDHGARVTIATFKEGASRLTFYEDPDGIPIEIQSTLKDRYRVRGAVGRGRRRRT